MSVETNTAADARLKSLFPAKSANISSLLERYRGIGPGFDALRLGLAFLIFYGHTQFVLQSGGNFFAAAAASNDASLQSIGGLDDIVRIVKSRLYVLYVPMFFALSGFLVASSAVRLKYVGKFLKFRALRIFPALTVEVTLSAIILGVTFSTLSHFEYYTDPGFFRYFGNIIGIVTFELPGVFSKNPRPGLVNINLWTLPAEFYCYLILSLIMVTGLLAKKYILPSLIALAFVAMVAATALFGIMVSNSVFSTPVIIMYFLIGVLYFMYGNLIPVNFGAFLISAIIVFLCMPYPRMAALMAPFLVYVTVYIGFMPFLALPFMKGRDYSYGIYLYGFPITQAVVALWPGISRLTLLAWSLPLTILVAALSWHFIEKPALKFKK